MSWFDFNNDGKDSLWEQLLAYKIFEETTEDDDSDYNEDEDEDLFDFDDIEMQGSNSFKPVSIPLNMTLNFVDSGKDKPKIKESDYPNKRQYKAACDLENLIDCSDDPFFKDEINRCRFILEKSDTFVAARYLTNNGEYLYSQAVKDNFDLPITLPDEDEQREFDFPDIIKKIARKDISLSLQVWSWCLEQFSDYFEYGYNSREDLTSETINSISDFASGFDVEFIKYICDNPEFGSKLICRADETAYALPSIIVKAIEIGYCDTATFMFKNALASADGYWKSINDLTNSVINRAENYLEVETIEFIENNFLPILSEYTDLMIAEEIEPWQQDIKKYKLCVEKSSDKYAYSRSNSWRKTAPDGKEYNLNILYFDSEAEYLKAYTRQKYLWRKYYDNTENYGLNPNDFETEDNFLKQREIKRRERFSKEKENDDALLNDKNIYIYCAVKLPLSNRPYYFRADNIDLKIGDTVIVPVGSGKTQEQGTVVSIGRYARIAVPYPVEKTKFILNVIE